MKLFTILGQKLSEHPKFKFVLWVAAFYVLMMALYLYMIHANLSTAPACAYDQF